MQEIIERIASVDLPNVFNPWKHGDMLDALPAGGVVKRIERLRAHFNCKPRFLLVGEAPGYQGCKFSGVPFTNEKLLLDGIVPRVFCGERITTRSKPWSEPSATVVWGSLNNLGIAAETVMWNAFPWHPHEPGNLYSNRTPTRAEFLTGMDILYQVVRHFDGAKVVAVGQKSAAMLNCACTWKFSSVRHPSMGGANKFREGLAAIVTAAPATT